MDIESRLDVIAALQNVMCRLQSLNILHKTAHWTTAGDTSYSDHLLFQRLYESIDDEIDQLAERMVSTCGASSVDPVLIAINVAEHVVIANSESCVVTRNCDAERALVDCCVYCIDLIEMYMRSSATGWNDFLGGVISEHERHIYLLEQRMQ